MIWLVIFAWIAGFGSGCFVLHQWFFHECPRSIKGYKCKGQLCDHSSWLVLKARMEMAMPLDDDDNNRPNFRGGYGI